MVGWGLDENEQTADTLKVAKVPVVSIETCIRSYPQFYSQFTSNGTFCAGSRNGRYLLFSIWKRTMQCLWSCTEQLQLIFVRHTPPSPPESFNVINIAVCRKMSHQLSRIYLLTLLTFTPFS